MLLDQEVQGNNRAFEIHPGLVSLPLQQHITPCSTCHRFYALCYFHQESWYEQQKICHNTYIVFTDGACSNNGRTELAQVGVGVFAGPSHPDTHDEINISIPLKESMFNNAVEQKTSQSAELVAAITGVHWFLGEMDRIMLEKEPHQLNKKQKRCRNNYEQSGETKRNLVIATDSQYVVKGMSEWLLNWKLNGYRNTRNQPISNKELFTMLDQVVESVEAKGHTVKFWHIPREFNEGADHLAKQASLRDTRG